MARRIPADREEALGTALGHLQAALDLLDAAEASPQIGAYVDMAICQLEEVIASEPGEPKVAARGERSSN